MKQFYLSIMALLTISAAGASTASAGLVISYTNLQESSPGVGSFEVVISNTESPGGASYNLTGFSYEIIAAPGTGMTFTDATITGLTNPYVFAGIGEQAAFSVPSSPLYDPLAPPFQLSYDTPGTDIFIADVAFLAPYTTIAPGATFSLGLISFTADPGLSLSDLTPLPDPTGGSLPIGSPVPEPSSLVMTGLAGALMLAAGRRFRSRERPE